MPRSAQFSTCYPRPNENSVPTSDNDDEASNSLNSSTLIINQFSVIASYYSVMAHSSIWCLAGFFL
jgi:hypothetical protein